MSRINLYWILSLFLLNIHVSAQVFRTGFTAGGILSQLDGDGFTGYHKLGKRIGIRSHAKLAPKLDFIIEMNWEEKGSQFSPILEKEEDPRADSHVLLAYAEIPLLFRLYRKEQSNIFLEAGAAISHLVKYRFDFDPNSEKSLEQYESVVENFHRSEWNLALGGGFAFNQHFGILFRTTIGLNHLYRDVEALSKNPGYKPAGQNRDEEPILLLRNYLVSLSAYYLI